MFVRDQDCATPSSSLNREIFPADHSEDRDVHRRESVDWTSSVEPVVQPDELFEALRNIAE